MNENVNYLKVPPHMRDGLELYVNYGVMGGSFLTAVLENNLVEAFGHADETNRHAMFLWAMWLHNDAPRGCWGSPEAVKAWVASQGLEGIKAREQMEATK
jgi:hypothetical protein